MLASDRRLETQLFLVVGCVFCISVEGLELILKRKNRSVFVFFFQREGTLVFEPFLYSFAIIRSGFRSQRLFRDGALAFIFDLRGIWEKLLRILVVGFPLLALGNHFLGLGLSDIVRIDLRGDARSGRFDFSLRFLDFWFFCHRRWVHRPRLFRVRFCNTFVDLSHELRL